jgi:hypothetical protein
MKHREGCKGCVIEVRTHERKASGFCAEFTLEEHDGNGVAETQFFMPDAFPTEESTLSATVQAGRSKIDEGFVASPSNML